MTVLRAPAAIFLVATSLAAASLAACQVEAEPPPSTSPVGEALAAIRAHEEARRAATDFTRVPGRNRALGPDPGALLTAPGGDGFVALLRGEDAVVAMGRDLAITARAPAVALATSLAVLDGEVLVAGEGDHRIARLALDLGALVPRPPIALREGTQVTALAGAGSLAFALDAAADVLVALDLQGERRRVATAEAPLRLEVTPRHIVVTSLVGHRVEIFARDRDGLPAPVPVASVVRQGPAWGLAAVEHGTDLWIAISAAEDAPLDRTVGAFGYVDSVVEIWRLRADAHQPRREAIFPAGEAGVVVPKALALEVDDTSVRLVALAAGSDRMARVTWPRTASGLGALHRELSPTPPGTSHALLEGGAVVAASSPLLDALWSEQAGLVPIEPATPDLRSPSSRLGEALLTTTLLAPRQSAEGALSRFTCETCHLDLGIDGRTHATGRGDGSVATTKPLHGLLNGGPHFTRAMDDDLTAVAHNEVRVAHLKTGHHPWSAIDPARAPWLGQLLGDHPDPALLRPAGVRQALVDALADLPHRPNPRVLGRSGFTGLERRGAEAFQARCVSCHSARLVVREPSTEVPFERWEELVFSEAGPIVWARDGRERTGIEPYVHPEGARTTSLRRVVDKRPYFTNGSARSLSEVLDGVRVGEGGTFAHAPREPPDPPPSAVSSAALSTEERAALLLFLRLL